jgi:hypothetical protein
VLSRPLAGWVSRCESSEVMERSARPGVALLAVRERELGPEAVVLLAQSLVLIAQRLEALAQRRFASALPRRNAVGADGAAIAHRLDLLSQPGLGVEPLARDAGAASNALEADREVCAADIAAASASTQNVNDLSSRELALVPDHVDVVPAPR